MAQSIDQKYLLNVEKSASGQSWLSRLDVQQRNNALAISQKFGLSDLVASVLSARGIDEYDALSYLDPTLKNLMPDPLVFTDMDKAANRIAQAIQSREKIAIFGDYDVDGACSSAIMARFLRHFGISCPIYIPDRMVEGYGPNENAMRMLVEDGASLIITVDCGANSPEAIAAARNAGGDVVVLDHHQMDAIHDKANALVNPNRPDDLSGQGHLCAAGVVFMALAQICRQLRGKEVGPLPDLLSYLDLVALATVCDVVPLIGVNRAFVVKGLQVGRTLQNKGIAALAKVARIGEPLNTFHFGFVIGPRINAGGRIGDQALGAKLLSIDDSDEADQIAEQLNDLNEMRQAMESEQLEQAEASLLPLLMTGETPSVIVVASADWHPGIVGLLAARLKERFQCPAFAIALKSDGSGTGSGRSVMGIDLGALVRQGVEDGLLLKGGGHAMAAGITIADYRVDTFRQWMEQKIGSTVDKIRHTATLFVDGLVSAGGANVSLYESLEKAGPYGAGNPMPVLVLPDHRLTNLREVGKGHLSLTMANSQGQKIKAIAFRSVGTPLGDFLTDHNGEAIHLAGNLTLNFWNGRVTPQIRVIDAAAT